MVKIAKKVKKRQPQVVRKRPAAERQPQVVRKGPAAATALGEEAVVPDWYGEADGVLQKQIFLVTAAKLVDEKDHLEKAGELKPPPLRNPANVSKVEFRTALQDSVANPMYEHKQGGRPPTRALELDVYVGVKEGKPGEQHHHAAVKLFDAKHRFLPFKLAMRWRHGIATHWSTSHTQLWSTIRSPAVLQDIIYAL